MPRNVVANDRWSLTRGSLLAGFTVVQTRAQYTEEIYNIVFEVSLGLKMGYHVTVSSCNTIFIYHTFTTIAYVLIEGVYKLTCV